MTEGEGWIVIGKITGAHGIRGEVKVTLYVDDTDFLREVEALYLSRRRGRTKMPVKALRFHKGQALVLFETVRDRTEAEQLRNREVAIPLEWMPALDEDEYYVSEIIGLTAETTEGEELGKVEQVIFTGANEVYILRGGPRGEILLPAIESVILDVDLEARRLLVDVPDGLLD